MEKDKKMLKPPVTKQLLSEIARRIAEKIKPDKVILFGSYANGKPNKDSDLDFFIIKKTRLPFAKRYAMVSDALYPRLIPMDFIVRTPDEIERRMKMFDPFLKEILENGKVIYENK